MNTISMNGQTMAMDGQQVYSAFSPQKGEAKVSVKGTLPNSASEVLQNFEASQADLEASVQELQRLSDIVTGHKLHFNVKSGIGMH